MIAKKKEKKQSMMMEYDGGYDYNDCYCYCYAVVCCLGGKKVKITGYEYFTFYFLKLKVPYLTLPYLTYLLLETQGQT